jgi:putative transposase
VSKRNLQFAEGCYYHLYNRGAHRRSIFIEDEDYRDFLARLRKNARIFRIALVAYCLMPNHFHLLVRQDSDASAGTAVQYTCNGYAQSFNSRYDHNGTLFQGRFQRILVDNDEYLRHLCRYIHTNPVKDGFVPQPDLWPYSDYMDWIGVRRGTAVERDFIAGLFGSSEAYVRFVATWPLRQQMPAPLVSYFAALEAQESTVGTPIAEY